MSFSEQGRNDVVLYRLEKAAKTMEEAKDNIPLGHWSLIANRLYYAAYYAVSGLLIASGHRVKSHEGTVSQFGLHFIKEGTLPLEMGRLYRQIFALRLTGDYEDNYNLVEEEVSPYIQPTEQLIEKVSELAKEKLQEPIQD